MNCERYNQVLPVFEKNEIVHYEPDEVYFTGNVPMIEKSFFYKFGSDFEDNHGQYKILIHDHIAFRYEIQKVLYKTDVITIVACFDHKKNEKVAMKIFSQRVDYVEEGKKLELLTYYARNDSTLPFVIVKACFQFRKHYFIVMELLHRDLGKDLEYNTFRPYDVEYIRPVIKTVLEGLVFLKRIGLVHGDIKPSNLAFIKPSSNKIKIIDFGHSKYLWDRVDNYRQGTIGYRAPEFVFHYKLGCEYDMWGLGCVALELAAGRYIISGLSEGQCIATLVKLMGMSSDIDLSTDDKWFMFSKTEPEPDEQLQADIQELTVIIKMFDPVFVNFVKRCLCWVPEKRITPEEGLKHEWILQEAQVNCGSLHLLHPVETHGSNVLFVNENRSISSSKFIKWILYSIIIIQLCGILLYSIMIFKPDEEPDLDEGWLEYARKYYRYLKQRISLQPEPEEISWAKSISNYKDEVMNYIVKKPEKPPSWSDYFTYYKEFIIPYNVQKPQQSWIDFIIYYRDYLISFVIGHDYSNANIYHDVFFGYILPKRIFRFIYR